MDTIHLYQCSLAVGLRNSVFKRLSKNRLPGIHQPARPASTCGTLDVIKNAMMYYGGKKSCCMCNAQEEDWIHILTCPSINRRMHDSGIIAGKG
jgi:hypothetical protein